MSTNKITEAKLIFRNINTALEVLTTCPEDQRNVVLYSLKKINGELCDKVIELVKERELKKIIRHEQKTVNDL